MRRLLTLAMAGTLALAGAACDSDEGGEGDLEAYCVLTAELDNVEGLPTDDQLDAIEDTAPPEIDDDVSTAADALRDADPDNPEAAFGDPELVEAFEDIEAFEEENCPGADGENGDTDDTTDDTVDDTTDDTVDDTTDDTDDTDTTDDTTGDTTDDTAGGTTETS